MIITKNYVIKAIYQNKMFYILHMDYVVIVRVNVLIIKLS